MPPLLSAASFRLRPLRSVLRSTSRAFTYTQGQYADDGKREYFYYIDHQGMLFLDDARMKNFTSCFKERHFLRFFFNRLKWNDTGKYDEAFPFVSPCGRAERNFVHCEDTPFVFNRVLNEDSSEPVLSYNNAGILLTVPFEPGRVCMVSSTGRVYHPAPERVGGFGLIADKLSIQWTQEKRFTFGHGEDAAPSEFLWKDEKVTLTNDLEKKIVDRNIEGKGSPKR